ncbi:MAG: MSMEG_4193 family putative phosphomutase [Anaerolineae bacterium]|nr:MSMEG_4193 family putative phosphomutase [Anaerolineae bacterium]
MTILLLIRHGENDFIGKGLAGRLQGVHLNDKGRRQAEALAEQLGKAPIKAIYSSPLERALETAQPLAERLGLEIQTRPGLIEVDYGEWEGKAFRQLKRLKLWKTIQTAPAGVRFPGGESLQEAQQRVCKEIETLAGFHEQEDLIACVTHADVIRLSTAYFLGMRLDDFQRLSVSIASMTVFQIHEKRFRLLHLNQVFALDWVQAETKKGGKAK